MVPMFAPPAARLVRVAAALAFLALAAIDPRPARADFSTSRVTVSFTAYL